jgi:hypothetical protein
MTEAGGSHRHRSVTSYLVNRMIMRRISLQRRAVAATGRRVA